MESEKKKKLPAWAKIVILLVVLAAALGIYAGLTSYNKNHSDDSDAETTTMLQVNAEDVTSMSYELDGVNYTFQRKNSKSDWTYQQDPSVKLDQDSVTNMLTSAADITTENVVADSLDDKSEYGLDDPVFTLKLGMKDGSEKTVYLGSQNSMTSVYYAYIDGDSRIFTVSSDFYSTFTTIDNLSAASSDSISASAD